MSLTGRIAQNTKQICLRSICTFQQTPAFIGCRFICREFLGERTDNSAAFLTPIAPDAVVYGSGDDAVVLSKEQAAQLYALNMAQYGDLKTRLLAINAGEWGAAV